MRGRKRCVAARQTFVTALRRLGSQRHIDRDSVPTGDPVAHVLVELAVERHRHQLGHGKKFDEQRFHIAVVRFGRVGVDVLLDDRVVTRPLCDKPLITQRSRFVRGDGSQRAGEPDELRLIVRLR